jgi:GT2 family glycosyltransferase
MNVKEFSIIVPTYNSKTLSDTLMGISRQTRLDLVKEILVVGQQDLKDDYDLPGFKYIHNDRKPTVTQNRNLGCRTAKGNWLCFIDSDCVPKVDWIEKLNEYIIDQDKAIGGAVDVFDTIPYWGRCLHYFSFDNQAVGISVKQNINYAATINFCISRELLLSMNCFDDRLSIGGEDRDLSWRLQNSGKSIIYAPDALVYHNHKHNDFKSAWKHSYQYGQNLTNFRELHIYPVKWTMFKMISNVPIVSELAGFIRTIVHCANLLMNNPNYIKIYSFLPGIFILELAKTLGVILTFRSHGTKNWNNYPELE